MCMFICVCVCLCVGDKNKESQGNEQKTHIMQCLMKAFLHCIRCMYTVFRARQWKALVLSDTHTIPSKVDVCSILSVSLRFIWAMTLYKMHCSLELKTMGLLLQLKSISACCWHPGCPFSIVTNHNCSSDGRQSLKGRFKATRQAWQVFSWGGKMLSSNSKNI